jgi:hypothetical protein
MAEELGVEDPVISALLGHASGGKVHHTYNQAERGGGAAGGGGGVGAAAAGLRAGRR